MGPQRRAGTYTLGGTGKLWEHEHATGGDERRDPRLELGARSQERAPGKMNIICILSQNSEEGANFKVQEETD